MNNFMRFYDETNNVQEAIAGTLQTTGRAILFTSLVLASGFFIYMFASLGNLFYFGLLTGLAILIAMFADFLISPALIVLAFGKK